MWSILERCDWLASSVSAEACDRLCSSWLVVVVKTGRSHLKFLNIGKRSVLASEHVTWYFLNMQNANCLIPEQDKRSFNPLCRCHFLCMSKRKPSNCYNQWMKGFFWASVQIFWHFLLRRVLKKKKKKKKTSQYNWLQLIYLVVLQHLIINQGPWVACLAYLNDAKTIQSWVIKGAELPCFLVKNVKISLLL